MSEVDSAIANAREIGRIVDLTCRDCGMKIETWNDWHPRLFCLIRRDGAPNPEAYLSDLGYVRAASTHNERGEEPK